MSGKNNSFTSLAPCVVNVRPQCIGARAKGSAAPALLAALASSSAFDNLASVASARQTSRCACMSAPGRASHAAKASAAFSAADELPAAKSDRSASFAF